MGEQADDVAALLEGLAATPAVVLDLFPTAGIGSPWRDGAECLDPVCASAIE